MHFDNTTNRSWWIISDPTYTRGRMFGNKIPPTAVGGFVHIQPVITVALAEISSKGRFFVG